MPRDLALLALIQRLAEAVLFVAVPFLLAWSYEVHAAAQAAGAM